MYCLGFRKGLLLGAEEKNDHTSVSYTSQTSVVRERLAPKCIAPKEFTGKIGLLRTYDHPPLLARELSDVSKHRHSRHEEDRWKIDVYPRIENSEMCESRFQNELESTHRALIGKETSSSQRSFKTLSSSIIGNFDSMLVSETEPVDRDLSMPLARNGGEDSNKSWRDNRILKKELKQTGQLLEYERVENIILQNTIDNMKNQVELLQAAHRASMTSNTNDALHDLRRQVTEYQHRLEDEQLKGRRLQQELESVKTENQKCKEKMHILMFQYCPTPSLKFQDIGPCTPNIIESSGKVATYVLGTILGEGHYGKVAMAADSVSKKQFAIKVLNKVRISRFKDLQQVAMEVHVLKNYPHENIVHLQGVIHASENIYLVMELCSMDLHKYHSQIGLEETGSQEVIYGILKALSHLHSHGICHLDLKPENILLAVNFDINKVTHYDVRLCDFGLVSMARNPAQNKDIVRRGYICGTPGFFAPEMIVTQMFEGRRADMWSLGCILLEITLGFTEEWIESYGLAKDDPSLFLRRIERCLEEIAPDYYPHHQKLLDLIHSCLAVDTSQRIRSSEAICHPWLVAVRKNDQGRPDSTRSLGTGSQYSLSKAYSERKELFSLEYSS